MSIFEGLLYVHNTCFHTHDSIHSHFHTSTPPFTGAPREALEEALSYVRRYYGSLVRKKERKRARKKERKEERKKGRKEEREKGRKKVYTGSACMG